MKNEEFDLRIMSGQEQFEYYQSKVEEFYEKYIKPNVDDNIDLADELIELSEDNEKLKKYSEIENNIFLSLNEDEKINFAKKFINDCLRTKGTN